MRIARSRISAGYLPQCVIAPSSQRVEPPTFPGRFKELPAVRHAVIIDPETKGGRANVGSTVKVLNLEMDREQTFQLVSPREVDPSGGKISAESPVGNAVINHVPGEEVLVQAPAGLTRPRVLDVEG